MAFEISNPFSSLDSTDANIVNDSQHQPKTSTPTRSSNQSRLLPPKNKNHKLKAIDINCNSFKSSAKQAAFREEVEYHKPDINLRVRVKN